MGHARCSIRTLGRWHLLLVFALAALLLWQCSDNPNEPETNTPINHAPQFNAIASQNVKAGDTLELNVLAADADGDSLTLGCTNLPANSEFVDNGDGSGDFTFMPTEAEIAVYQLRFVASDRELSDTLKVQVTVLAQPNRAPELMLLDTATVMEGDTLRLSLSATDPDGTVPDIACPDLPANGSLTGAEGSAEFLLVPDSLQVGVIEVAFVASDGDLADTEAVSVTVIERPNWAPILTVTGDTEVMQGDTLELLLTTTDLDGDSLILSAEDIPDNATFVDSANGTGVFMFTPDYVQVGNYEVIFIAGDGVLADTAIVTLEVLDAGNQAPVIQYVGQQYVLLGDSLTVDIHYFDPDGTIPTFEILETPPNSYWADNAADTVSLHCKPEVADVGDHIASFLVNDGQLADTLTFTLTVVLDTMSLLQDGPIPSAVGNYWVFDVWTWDNFGLRLEDSATFTIVGVEFQQGRFWWQLSQPFRVIGSKFAMSGDTLFTAAGVAIPLRPGEQGIYPPPDGSPDIAEIPWSVESTDVCSLAFQPPACSCAEIDYSFHAVYKYPYHSNGSYAESLYFAGECGLVGSYRSWGSPMQGGTQYLVLTDVNIREAP